MGVNRYQASTWRRVLLKLGTFIELCSKYSGDVGTRTRLPLYYYLHIVAYRPIAIYRHPNLGARHPQPRFYIRYLSKGNSTVRSRRRDPAAEPACHYWDSDGTSR